jgi:hypothetical protein
VKKSRKVYSRPKAKKEIKRMINGEE